MALQKGNINIYQKLSFKDKFNVVKSNESNSNKNKSRYNFSLLFHSENFEPK